LLVDRAAVLALFSGLDLVSSIDAACALLPESNRSVLIAAAGGWPDQSTVSLVERAFRDRTDDVAILIAPATSVASFRQVRSTQWQPVDLGDRASRIEHARLPHQLVTASTIVGVGSISGNESPGDPIALGLWSQFAHPSQRLGARLSNPRDGLAAEIALAVSPSLILLAAELDGIPIVTVASDQIAAELAGLAIRQILRPESGSEIGPWENPLVQRATELGIGIAIPAQIVPTATWVGTPDDPQVSTFYRLARQVLARIGVAFPE